MSDTPADDDRTSASRGDDRGRGTGRGRRDDSPSGGRPHGNGRPQSGGSRSGGGSAGGSRSQGGSTHDRGGSSNRGGSGSSASGGAGGPRRDSAAQGRGRPQSGDRSQRGGAGGGGTRAGGTARSGNRDQQRDGGWSRDGQRGGAGGGSRGGQYTRDGQSGGNYRRDGQGGGSFRRDGGNGGRYGRDGHQGRDGQGREGQGREGQGRDRTQGYDGRPRRGTPAQGGARRSDSGRGSSGRADSNRSGSWDPNRKPGASGDRPGGRGGHSGRGRDGRSDALWTKDGRPARGDRAAREHEHELDAEAARARELRSVRPRHDDPDIPGDVEARQLPKEARVELKTLSKDNADWVAQHLVMASRLIESDPELAHRHALSASRRAGRIGIVRETLAITAYATGDFALALRELRTYRRISGSNDQIALMVDSERGVGRPDRALELGRSVDRASLPTDVQVALAIAMSGARLDLGQDEAALAELEIPQLDPNRAFSWSPDLFHAYAEVLEALGREADAATWRERAERAELALEEAHADAELETIHVVEEDFELEDEPDDGAVSTDE